MKIYELAASKNSPMYEAVLGRFTSEKIANEAFHIVPENIRTNFHLEVREAKLGMNTVSLGGGKAVDVTERKMPEEVLSNEDAFGRVHGYVKISIYEMLKWNCDKEKLTEVISERMIGSNRLCRCSFDIVGVEDGYILVLSVDGTVTEP
jgi:hypothetical protein